VDNSNDVQDAWNRLINQYEGHDARHANIQKACFEIADARWERNTRDKTFDLYCNTHTKANNELNRYKANVDGRTQVDNFLKGIRADSRVNPHFLSIKAIIVNDPITNSDLVKAVQVFKDTMRLLMGTSSEREQR
jgi:hypothetical protein